MNRASALLTATGWAIQCPDLMYTSVRFEHAFLIGSTKRELAVVSQMKSLAACRNSTGSESLPPSRACLAYSILLAAFMYQECGGARGAQSVVLLDEPAARKRQLVVVGARRGPFGQLHLLPRHFLVRDRRQDVADAVEPSAALVVRSQDVPRRVLPCPWRRASGLSPASTQTSGLRDGRSIALSFHCRSGSSMRASKRRFCSWSLTSSQILISWIPPSVSMMNCSTNGHSSRNSLVLLLGAEPHHVLDPGPVVPAAVEDHDFPGCREVLHEPLHVKSATSRGPTAPAGLQRERHGG